jgi:hypothetical protein
MARALATLWTFIAAACGPSFGVSRSFEEWNGKAWIDHPPASPQPPRPNDCDLERLLPTSQMPVATSHYIAIGEVWFVGGNLESADVFEGVWRRACALGGDAVMLVRHGRTFRSGGMATYYVLKHGVATAPRRPTP